MTSGGLIHSESLSLALNDGAGETGGPVGIGRADGEVEGGIEKRRCLCFRILDLDGRRIGSTGRIVVGQVDNQASVADKTSEEKRVEERKIGLDPRVR